MTIRWQEQVKPGAALRILVQEATAALVAMDAQRLEELAQCCADLNRDLQQSGEMKAATVEIDHVGADEVHILGRVLFETRANLVVLSRLHAIRVQERFFPILNASFGTGAKGVAYGDN